MTWSTMHKRTSAGHVFTVNILDEGTDHARLSIMVDAELNGKTHRFRTLFSEKDTANFVHKLTRPASENCLSCKHYVSNKMFPDDERMYCDAYLNDEEFPGLRVIKHPTTPSCIRHEKVEP